jgi:hypothetical protein
MFVLYWIINTWKQLETSDKIHIFLSILTLITLIYFIRQTDITQESLELAQQDFYVRNSPYLLIDIIYYDHFITNDSITFKLKIRNFGQSPAFNTLVSDILVFENQPTSIDNHFTFDSSDFQIVEKYSDYFIVKSNGICTGTDYRYEDKFIIGKILYRDIFNRNLFTIFAGWFNNDRFIPVGELNKIGIIEE